MHPITADDALAVSPVPFGVGCYHPRATQERDKRSTQQVTSAFRRGVLSPQGREVPSKYPHGSEVTSAFRRGVLSPRPPVPQIPSSDPWSPVPFGVGCYHPTYPNTSDGVRRFRHQCLSAWGAITPRHLGVGSCQNVTNVTSAFRRGVLSPPNTLITKVRQIHGVTSAFRRGVLSPREVFEMDLEMEPSSHQCLSAWGAITPDGCQTGDYSQGVQSPVPFGVGCYHPRRRSHWMTVSTRCVTSAFRRGVLSPPAKLAKKDGSQEVGSPVPFGVGCYHPS